MRCISLLLLLALLACEQTDGSAYARRITSSNELIGGPAALGTIGDWAMGNDKIRVIIQDQGWSRGFGIFGGGIIDADITRPNARGTSDGGTGKDNFGEYFPVLFLQAFDVHDLTTVDRETGQEVAVPGIEILKDGTDGEEAVIRTHASGGDFITLISTLVGALIPARGLRFETDYIIRPGTRHVEIVGRLRNIGRTPITLPGDLAGLLGDAAEGIELQVPVGDVALFGAGNTVYAPGAVMREGRTPKPIGFDLRFSVEAAYTVERTLPALPGLVTDFLATASDDVSYGFAAGPSDRNYVWLNRGEYEKDDQVVATQHAMLVPFLISSFTGAYFVVPPAKLAPVGQQGDTFEYTRYFIVGHGDVASIRDELFSIRGAATSRLWGRVVNQRTGLPETDAWIHVLDDRGRPYNQVKPNEHGRFTCKLEPGSYSYKVTAPGRRPVSSREPFIVEAGLDTGLFIVIPPPAELAVRVRDDKGQPLPAKVSLVSRYESPEEVNADPMEFLFDLSLHEQRRFTDLSWQKPAAQQTHLFVEDVLYTHNGYAHGRVRPSCVGDTCRDYDIVVSRGPEYDLHTIPGVRLEAGVKRELDAVLTRSVDTTNWISTDLHVHSIGSADSYLALEPRVTSAAAEGLEMPVSTDHNYLMDFRPTIEGLGLGDWVTTMVGVELSTLEMGHFNGFPLRYDIGSPSHFPLVKICYRGSQDRVNRTSYDWVECSPDQLFSTLRQLGRFGVEDTIVQVNHPRDTILGYFNQYYLNPYTVKAQAPEPSNYPETAFTIQPHDRVPGQFQPESFSFAFDAIEVFNGKRFDMLHAFRIADDTPQETVDRLRDPCAGGHPANGLDEDGRGKVRLRNGGHIAYPGAVDDWLRMLNAGHRFTATGNSDSHTLASQIGYPRTYVWVEPAGPTEPRDLPVSGVSDLDVVDALKAHRAITTNGPFLEMWVLADVLGQGSAGAGLETRAFPIGSTVTYACNPDGSGVCQGNIGREVRVLFHLRSAPWIDVDEIVVWANGEILERIPIRQGEDPTTGRDYDDDNTLLRGKPTYVFDRDVVLVAEALGSDTMFPVVPPKEEPLNNLGEALGGLAGGLGFDVSSFGGGDGIRAPSYVQVTRPYALTNPIWLDIDGDGEWTPPGNDAGPGPAPEPPPGICPEPRPRRSLDAIVKRALAPPSGTKHYAPTDIRKIFHGHHPH